MIHIVVSCACQIPILIGNITGRRASVNQGFSKATGIYPESEVLSLLDFISPNMLMLNINMAYGHINQKFNINVRLNNDV